MAEQSNWNSNVRLTGTNDNDTLNNWSGSNVTIDAGNGDNTVYVYEGTNIFITSGAGNDSVRTLNAAQLSIGTDGGNDTITNNGANATIDAGAGNDVIENVNIYIILGDDPAVSLRPDNSSLLGGLGNDSIKNEGAFVTLSGGSGNDTLTGSAQAEVFVYSAGNDVITNYSGEDKIFLATGGNVSWHFSGADLIFQTDAGSLTLKSMKNHAVTVTDSAGQTSTQIYGTGYSGADVMKNFVQSMINSSGSGRVDAAIRASSNSYFNSAQDVVDRLLSDLRSAGDAETFLRDYCGIFTDNDDTGAITGWDAGGLAVKTADDLMPPTSDTSYPSTNYFTRRGLTLTDIPSNLGSTERSIVQSLYTHEVEDALKLIEESYGVSFTNKPTSIPLNFTYAPDRFGAAWAGLGGLTINTSADYDGFYTIPHELTHVAQQAFDFFDGMPAFMFEGMADLTAGVDVRDFKTLTENPSWLAYYLDLDNTSTNDGNIYGAGEIFWRYFMRQSADNYGSQAGGNFYVADNQPVNHIYTGGNQVIANYKQGDKIILGTLPTGFYFSGTDFIFGSTTGALGIANASDKVLDFRDGNDNPFLRAYAATNPQNIDGRNLDGFEYIVGSAQGSDNIIAGNGGSQLWGGAGNFVDVLTGGLGVDNFLLGKSDGNDAIQNAASVDSVNLYDVTLSDLIATAEDNGLIGLAFNTGNVVTVRSTETLSARFNLADGSSFRFNHATKSWQGA